MPAGATLKAIAFKSGLSDSAIKIGTYTATAACAAPVFNPREVISGPHPPANYTVNMSTTTSGAQMRYTRNGPDPTATTGTLINGTSANITIGANSVITLKAITFKSGYSDSAVTSGYFDNQNGGGNRPLPKEGQETSRSEEKTSPAEPTLIGQKRSEETAPEKKGGTKLSRYQFNLWNSFALGNDRS